MTDGEFRDPEILIRTGWSLHDKCECGGTLKYTYRHNADTELELKWFPRRKGFKTFRRHRTIIGWTRINELEKTILKILQDC